MILLSKSSGGFEWHARRALTCAPRLGRSEYFCQEEDQPRDWVIAVPAAQPEDQAHWKL